MVTAFALVRLGNRIGLARAIERLYAAAVVTSAGAWLATATAEGIARWPLLQIILRTGLPANYVTPS
jgi:hypothetical protein